MTAGAVIVAAGKKFIDLFAAYEGAVRSAAVGLYDEYFGDFLGKR